MERLVRLNEVQYAATEAQAERLKEQGFRVEALPEEAPETRVTRRAASNDRRGADADQGVRLLRGAGE